MTLFSASLTTLESAVADNYRHLTNILREYRKFGFKTEVDDSETGSSGLNRLADIQPDLITLDILLISNVDPGRVRQAIVRALSQSVPGLDVTVIATGIETPKYEAFCRSAELF